MFSGASNFVESVDTAFLFIVAISVALLVLVTGLMIYFVIKYNRKRNPKAVNIHGNIPLEITWTIIPTILVLAMFWFGWVGYKQMSEIPEDAYQVEVTAQMWLWKFHYPNGKQADSLFVPVNKPISLDLKSLDVNHAFFVPAFRIKRDVYANRENKIWFEATETGSYNIFCAEYCGLNHSSMLSHVIVLPEDEFNAWLNSSASQTSTPIGEEAVEATPAETITTDENSAEQDSTE